MAAMMGTRSRVLTIKAALVLGFGAILGLWLFAGIYFTRRIDAVQRDAAAVNRRYMEAQELLGNVRTEVLLESLAVRDALLDPGPQSIETSRTRVREISVKIDETLRQYVPILDSEAERARVGNLRREIDEFSATLLAILDTDYRTWREQAPVFLGRIMPRRATVMQMSDDFQRLNRGAFVQQQEALAEIYRTTQTRVWQTLTFALATSLAIALVAITYVSGLEHNLRRQRARELQNTEDLQRLSTKLVTAQEQERRTIARELHDEIGQVLLAIKVELSLAQRRIESAGGEAHLLDVAQGLSDGALHTIRDLSRLLHPAILDDLGLAEAVRSYVDGFSRRHGIPVEFLPQEMDERLAVEIESAAYRIVQEALTNVAKHSDATLAFVDIRRADDVLQIVIQDDGIGFDPAQAARGLGLIGIRERATNLGGQVAIDSAAGRGTRLVIELPAERRVAPIETLDALGDTTDATMKSETTLG
jgi:signal transduction histidine kinase